MRENFSVGEIERAKTDTELFTELFRAFAPRIYSYVSSRAPCREDAEEVSSQIWEQIVKSFPKFEPVHEASFPAWIFRIARNKLNDFYRKRRVATVSIDALSDASLSFESTEELEKNELFLELVDLMERLPKKQREVLELKYFSDLKNKEIAAVLKVDERTVASNLSRAIKKMQNFLNSDAVKLFSERYID